MEGKENLVSITTTKPSNTSSWRGETSGRLRQGFYCFSTSVALQLHECPGAAAAAGAVAHGDAGSPRAPDW